MTKKDERLRLRYFIYPFLAVLTILVLMALSYFRNVNSLTWLLHSQEVRLKIKKIRGVLQDAEIGQRGYIITQEKKYLEPYKQAAQDFQKFTGEISVLVNDNPAQLVRVDSIQKLSLLKFAEMEATNKLIDKGDVIGAIEIVRSDVGKQYMDKIRVLSEEMYLAENLLLQERDRRLIFWRNVSIAMILVALLVIGFSLYFLYKKIKPIFDELLETKNTLKNVNDNLSESLYNFKKSNQENEHQVRQLRSNNEKLDKFVHVVSQDLKSSLEKMNSELIEVQKNYENKLSGVAPAYISAIYKIMQNMKSSIEDISDDAEYLNHN